MSGLFSKPKVPQVDNSALRRAEEARQRSDEAARLAEARKQSAEDANDARKKRVSASGRESTVLTDNNNKTLLGG